MTYTVQVRIYGKPVPKGRPRFTKFGGVYTPKTTVDFENKVALAWRDQHGDLALNGQLEAWLYFGTQNHAKQDVDNLAKSVLDGLQRGGAFVNGDEQIYKMTVSKFPATREDEHVVVVFRRYDYAEHA